MAETILIVLFFVLGVAAGLFLGKLAYTPAAIGTLRVDDESDPDSDRPFVALEIDKGHYNDLYEFDHVVCRVDHTPYVPQK